MEIDLDCFYFTGVAEFCEAFLCFGKVLFFVAEEIEFGWIVLEEMGTDAIPDTCTATCDDVGLAAQVRDVLVGVEGVASEHDGSFWGDLM